MERIGPYELVKTLGEGGMGIVHEARQERPIKRTVALKVIKAGMDTKQVVARFEAERQALALMDHPGIAKVLDGGETETGRPYFVMELVEGLPINAYAEKHALSLEERLVLFTTVCRAVEHAHQKGIIHRDLKPSNILVATHDGSPMPRIIDFGIAKAIAGRSQLTEKTLFTSYNQVLGTPAYMSPEQLDVSGNDLDTRTDIYAMGVLLYELLTGSLPFEHDRLAKASPAQLEAILCEEEPPLPSKRRKPDLKGDLDWIVMKAMAKDPSQRYSSAGDLARDVDHFLAHEPVSAAAPSTSYVLSKFAKRHRLGLAFVGSLLTLLIAGAVVSTHQAIRAVRAERAEEEKSRLALQRQEASDAMLDFITLDLLGQARPSEQADRDIKLTKVLEGAAERVNDKFADQPRIRCFMNLRLASIFENLGRFDEADELALQAQDALEDLEMLGPPQDDVEQQERRTLDADVTYQFASHHMGRSNFRDALPILKESLRKNLACRGPKTLVVAEIHENLGQSYHGLGDRLQAIEAFETAWNLYREIDPPELAGHLITLTATLAQIHQMEGNNPRSELFLEECQKCLETVDVPEKHTLRISALNNLGAVYMRRGEPEKAVGLLERCLELVREVMGSNHVRMATTGHNLGACYVLLKRYEDAYPLYLRAWKQQVDLAGASNEWSLIFLRDLAQCAGFLGKRKEHERYLEELVEQAHEHFGDNHYLMKAAIGQYRDFWPENSDKLTEVRQRLASEEPWPLSKTLVLVPMGATWHYHTGSPPPATWNQAEFQPVDWNQGTAPFGYGEAFISTHVPMGDDPEKKWAGSYFVTSFEHSPNTSVVKLRLRARRDDGIAVFLNGQEILRQHLPPSSETTWETYASREVGGIEEELFYVTEIGTALLRQNNTLAAQVHQCNGNSSDLSFDLTVEALLE